MERVLLAILPFRLEDCAMCLCRDVGELARAFVGEGFAVCFEIRDNPEFEFSTILVLALSCVCRQLPFCRPPRWKPTAKDYFALVSWDFATPVASLLPLFLLLLEQPSVDALGTRGKFAYGFLAVLHYPVAMILLPGSLSEMRRDSWAFPVELVNALQLGKLPAQKPALV